MLQFTVSMNDNVYFATSKKTCLAFCKKHNLVLWNEEEVNVRYPEDLTKVERGIYRM